MAIVDATIIESNARPYSNKTIEGIPKDRREIEFKENQEETANNNDVSCKEELSADVDAAWLKKGSKSYFGYKSFATVDEEGFISKTMTVPANESETNKLESMIIDAKSFSGDKAYDSKNNRRILRTKGIKTRILYKKPKNKPMTNWQKKFNKAASSGRFRVEQSFGTIKRIFKFRKASYFTTEKVQAQFTMKAMCLNLLKAVNKIELIPPKLMETG